MVARRSSPKVRPADRVASTIILICLGCIGLAVYLTGRSGDLRSPLGLDSRWAAGSAIVPAELDSLALASTRVYGPEDLYEYINGQAPHYIQFGFRAVLVAEYAAEAAAMPSIIVDLYDMERRRNAYGLFMESFPPEAEMIELGNAGYQSDTVAVFWKGPYYVRVMGLAGTDRESEVHQAASRVASRIEDESRELAEFSVFPRAGLDAGSLTFIKAAAFGLAHLRETFAGTYETSDGTYRLFFCDLDNDQEVRALLEAHAEFLRGREGLEGVELGEGEGRVWGEDRYLGRTLLIGSGPLVAGVLRYPEAVDAQQLAVDLLKNAVRTLNEDRKDGAHETD